VLRDFNVFGIAFPPGEADAVLVIDPDAVLALAVAAKGLELVPRRDR
jgi:hypothetical protein